eukprot:g2850.t1
MAGHPVSIIFLDVDGVLNDNWHGHNGSAGHGDELDSTLIANLATLVGKAQARGLKPRVVITSTWRNHPALREKLLAKLEATLVPGPDNIGAEQKQSSFTNVRSFLFGGEATDVSVFGTPDLGDEVKGHGKMSGFSLCPSLFGTSPEGRAAEIRAWLRARKDATTTAGAGGGGGGRQCFVVLDDLNILFTSDGRVNNSVVAKHFVHTIEEAPGLGGKTRGPIGLTKARVAEALAKLEAQHAERAALLLEEEGSVGDGGRSGGGGGRGSAASEFSADDWALLEQGQGAVVLDLLRKENCPFWVTEAARTYLREHRQAAGKRRVSKAAGPSGCLLL